jgi:hypothetical protein
MPISKNRKGHAKKANARKIREKERKAHLENMYKQMMFQLKDKNTSVPEMLNKEDVGLPSNPDQTTLGHENVVTITRNNAEDDSYTEVEAPVADPNEPIRIMSPRVII